MICIDAVWLATEPMDMRAGAGADTALARVIKVFGAAHPNQAYLFANRRANRMKVLVIDGLGIWLAARRLHQGRFVWSAAGAPGQVSLSRAQLNALILDLPWQRIGEGGIITVVCWAIKQFDLHGAVLKSLFGHARIGAQGRDGHTARHGSRT